MDLDAELKLTLLSRRRVTGCCGRETFACEGFILDWETDSVVVRVSDTRPCVEPVTEYHTGLPPEHFSVSRHLRKVSFVASDAHSTRDSLSAYVPGL